MEGPVCPKCRAEVFARAHSCMRCGSGLRTESKPSSTLSLTVALRAPSPDAGARGTGYSFATSRSLP